MVNCGFDILTWYIVDHDSGYEPVVGSSRQYTPVYGNAVAGSSRGPGECTRS